MVDLDLEPEATGNLSGRVRFDGRNVEAEIKKRGEWWQLETGPWDSLQLRAA